MYDLVIHNATIVSVEERLAELRRAAAGGVSPQQYCCDLMMKNEGSQRAPEVAHA